MVRTDEELRNAQLFGRASAVERLERPPGTAAGPFSSEGTRYSIHDRTRSWAQRSTLVVAPVDPKYGEGLAVSYMVRRAESRGEAMQGNIRQI